MTFKSHKSLLMLAALLFVSSAQAATKLYTEYIVSTNGTILYTGETSRGSSVGIVYTQEVENVVQYIPATKYEPEKWVSNAFLNYYICVNGTNYYALSARFNDTEDVDSNVIKTNALLYTRCVADTDRTAYVYPTKDSFDAGRDYCYELNQEMVDLYIEAGLDALVLTNKLDIEAYSDYTDGNGQKLRINIGEQKFRIDWECEISYIGGEGAVGTMASQIVTNEVTLASNEFTKPGYSFTNWWWKGNTYYEGEKKSGLTRDITFEAQWVADNYKVTLDPDMTDGVSTNVTATYGELMPLVSPPEREGYKFEGYFAETNGVGTGYYKDDGTCTNKCDFTADKTLYAKWKVNEYEIRFEDDNEQEIKTVKLNYGELIKPNAPTGLMKVGCTFAGWSPSLSYDDIVPAHNVTYTAQWTTNAYEITFDANGGSGGIVTNLLFGAPMITPPEVTKTGFAFKGWDPEVPETVPAQKMTYVAQWEDDVCTVSFWGNGGDVDKETTNYIVGLPYSIVGLPGARYEGHFFAGWWTDYEGGKQITNDSIVERSITRLFAHWIEDVRFPITFDPTDGVLTTTNVVVYTNGVAYSWMPIPVSTNNLFFAGWWTSTDPTNRVQLLPDMVATNTIDKLYARWKEMPPVLTVKENGTNNETNCVWGTEFGSLAFKSGDNGFAWWCHDTEGKQPVADDFVITSCMTVTPRYTNTEISNVVKIPELAFALSHDAVCEDWYAQAGNDGIRSGKIPGYKEDSTHSGGGTRLIAWLKSAGTVDFDYLTSLSDEGEGVAARLRWRQDDKTGLDSWCGKITGETTGTDQITGVYHKVEWEVNGGFTDRTDNYAILSNIKYTPKIPDWVSEWSSTNSVDSTLKLGTAPECGVLTFEWRVNGETGYTDTNGVYRLCDYLKLYDESGNVLSVSEGFMDTNETDFVTVTITNNTAIAHTFSWRYVKDYDVNAGDDGAWVKNITWTPTATTPTESTVEYEYESPDGTKQTLTIRVPNDWVDEYELKTYTGESDYFAALTNLSGKADCNGVKLPYWADYIFGTDPTNSASVFTVTNISVAAGVVTLQWTPNLGDRDYKVWGKTNLLDAVWHSPTNSSTRFFMVEVSLPEQE